MYLYPLLCLPTVYGVEMNIFLICPTMTHRLYWVSEGVTNRRWRGLTTKVPKIVCIISRLSDSTQHPSRSPMDFKREKMFLGFLESD